jgi:hypothetical protein
VFVRGLIMAAAAMVLAIVLRQFAIHALYLDWNDNAYSSVIVALPILHLTW